MSDTAMTVISVIAFIYIGYAIFFRVIPALRIDYKNTKEYNRAYPKWEEANKEVIRIAEKFGLDKNAVVTYNNKWVNKIEDRHRHLKKLIALQPNENFESLAELEKTWQEFKKYRALERKYFKEWRTSQNYEYVG